MYSRFIWSLEIIGKFAKEQGIKIWNCSYSSLLDKDIFNYYEGLNG